VISRFVFPALSVAFAVAVMFAIVTTVKHTSGTRADRPIAQEMLGRASMGVARR
jgi:hypothetical protein